MKHKDFPVEGYEFMNEAGTEEQKEIIVGLIKRLRIPIDGNAPWPNPFSKWDAKCIIRKLRELIDDEEEES